MDFMNKTIGKIKVYRILAWSMMVSALVNIFEGFIFPEEALKFYLPLSLLCVLGLFNCFVAEQRDIGK